MLQGCSGSCNGPSSDKQELRGCLTHLGVEVNAAVVKEVVAILQGSEGRHHVQRALTDPAVGPVIAVILKIILKCSEMVRCT